MKDKVDELYELATQKFESNGYEVTSGSNSETDYGHSRYFYVNQNNESKENSGLGFQVRVSDHSTGDRRILNGEQFIFDIGDVEVVFNKINYWFHPEEYKNVVAVKNKVVTIEVGEKDLLPTDEIISERMAKTGSMRFQIKRTYKNEGIVPTQIESGFKLPFKPNNPDIRFEEGGKTKRTMKKVKRGGITYGNSHAKGGIPVKNQSTGDMLEVEGGEGIVNKRSMASDKMVKLNGKDMTICEAVSQLNQLEGGVQFSCDDVEHQQFIEEMAKGGELERGTRTEMEHYKTLNDLYAKRITPKQASERIAKDHLKEDARYYSKLAKMEGKMADGGKVYDDEGNIINLKVGDRVIEFRKTTSNNPPSQIGSEGKIIEINGNMAKIQYEPNNYEQYRPLKYLKKIKRKMADGGKFNVKYDVTQKPDENGFYYIIYTQTGKIVPSSKIPQEIGYGQVKNQFFAKRKKYDNSLGLQDAIFIAMKMNESDVKMANGGTTADNPYAEFGLKKDFKGNAISKLDKLEEVSTNYCEVNKKNCASNVGVDRKDMPQIYEEHMDDYIDFLDSKGITYEMDFGVEVGKLKPTQENISIPRIKKILTRLENGYYTDTKGSKLNPLSRRLIATNDGYILDGHHRWATLLFLSPKNKMDVLRINSNIRDLVSVSKDFDLASVSEFAYGGKVEVKVPNYTSKDEKDITTAIIKRNGFPSSGVTLSPTLTYDYDTATSTRTNEGYTDEMFTISIGKRSLTTNRSFSLSTRVAQTLNTLKNSDKYKDKFGDILFQRDSENRGRLIMGVKNLYERFTAQNAGVPPKVIIISGTDEKNSIDISIWFPPNLSNLKDDEDIFEMFFDALNENTKNPNRDIEADKIKAKEESKQRKEKLKQVEDRFSTATGYPPKMKAYNPRTLYRFKTEAELMAQYNNSDWKVISSITNLDWLKKASNRKVLGLKVNKDAQYIMKFLFSPMYYNIWSYNTNQRNMLIRGFDKVFDVDFTAFKIKDEYEIQYISRDLFTIEQEDYYSEDDVIEDIGAKILNQEELLQTSVQAEDFFKDAIVLADIDAIDSNWKSNYQGWIKGKIAPIFESEYNSYIPSEIWQFLKMLQEKNLTFKNFTAEDLNILGVVYLSKVDGKYIGFKSDRQTIVNDDIDPRIINFLRFMFFFENLSFQAEDGQSIYEIISRKDNQKGYGSAIVFKPLLEVIFRPFKIAWYTTQPIENYREALSTKSAIQKEQIEKRKDIMYFLGVRQDVFGSRGNGDYDINPQSEFFQEVDFNKSKFNWEYRYLTEEQLQNGDELTTAIYFNELFFNERDYASDNVTLQKIGLNSEAKDILGTEIQPELMNVFEDFYYNEKPSSMMISDKLSAGSQWSFTAVVSLDDLKAEDNGYTYIATRKYFLPIKYIAWMEFMRDFLDTNRVNSTLIDFSLLYNGTKPSMVQSLVIQNPIYSAVSQGSSNICEEYLSNATSGRYFQILPKIESSTQKSLLIRKSDFEKKISALTSLLNYFESDEPLKQKVIFDKIRKVRKEQEDFLQRKYFKGDLTNLLKLYANGQSLGGQRDINVTACGLSTPTGEPSELDLQQYKMVRTPNFKKWFGDWELAYQEKDYSAVSKAINPKTAEPIVCYHGKGNMRAEATYFNLANFPVKYVGTNLSYSVWFANMGNPISVIYEFYAKCVNPIDLSVARLGNMTPIEFKEVIRSLYGYEIKTTMISEDRPQRMWQMLRANPLMLKEIRDNTEYDSIIMYEDNPSDILPNGQPNSTLDYVVFANNQLKSADNRNSTFLIDSPDFRFDDGGLITTHL